MFKICKIVSAVALAVAGVSANAGVVIDDFSFDQATASDNTAQNAVYDKNDGIMTSSGFSASIMGGYRDLYVEKTGGAGAINLGIDETEGWLAYDSTGSAQGVGVVRWDGANTGMDVDVDGLAGQNITADAAGIQLNVIAADKSFDLTFDVWTDKDLTAGFDWQKDSYTVTVDMGQVGDFYIAFSNFGSAIFSNVGAIQLMIDGRVGVGALDFTVDIIQAVPEPGSLALAGLALAGLGMAGRRRKAAK